MNYIKTNDPNIFIEFDPNKLTSVVLKKSELEAQIAEAQERLSQIPDPISDSVLLEWARSNYPQTNYQAEIDALNQTIASNTQRLEAMK